MRRSKLALLTVMALVAFACGTAGDGDGAEGTAADGAEELTGEVSAFGAPTGDEGQAIQAIIEENINANVGYSATYEGSDSFEEQIQIRVEGGNPPDVALYPQPGALVAQAEQGNLISLEDLGFDIAELESTFGEYLIGLGEHDGQHYALPTNVNLKSLVWYPLPEFTDAGYEPPATWDDMIALSDSVLSDESAQAPWCIGFGSEAATGWPGTDWIEDIMLRTAGAETYDQWVNHEIPFNHESVVTAFETFSEVVHTDGYVLGGAEQIPAIDFRDAPDPMFNDPPGCMMHRQATFIATFFPEGTVADEDYAVFAFPDIEEGVKGALIAGEFAAVFNDRPEVRDFLQRFVSEEVQCAQGSILEGQGGRISPNTGVGPDCYASAILSTAAQAIIDAIEAGGARFDASDLMPPEVGSGSFWTAMNDFAQQGPDAIPQILQNVEDSWPSG